MSFQSGTFTDVIFQNTSDYSLASFTTETSLFNAATTQPYFPAGFFDYQNKPGRSVRILARGVASSTGTPSYTFKVRLGSTSGPSFITGSLVGATGALATNSSITSLYWELTLDLTCNVPGVGSGNCTLSGCGMLISPGAFSGGTMFSLDSTPGTWTQTIDDSVTQWVNITAVSTASSSSNSIKMKQLFVFGLN